MVALSHVADADVDPANVAVTPDSSGAAVLSYNSSEVEFGEVAIGASAHERIVLLNPAANAEPLTIFNAWLAEPDAVHYSTDFEGPVVLNAGDSLIVDVAFAPKALLEHSAPLYISHDGDSNLDIFTLVGRGVEPSETLALDVQRKISAVVTEPSFTKSVLIGTRPQLRPTSLQFGPDERLYVANMLGDIDVFDVEREEGNGYRVIAEETITLVRQIPNHDDDGRRNDNVGNRLVTGLLVTGTSSNPIVYVASSDPRIGGGGSHTDTNLDTNSGVLSRLSRADGQWLRSDLVRGLPRSEENHHANGMVLDEGTQMLYLAQGGNTNLGAPSANFALLPEFALSAAILSIDLAAIGDSTYDLPTLDDKTRPGVVDSNDPFGGNNGLNQAKLVPGGPVQVYAPGFRNAYDLVLTDQGRMYTVDNGGNAGWGDKPVGASADGTCSNEISEPGKTHQDALHFIDQQGYYGGHPNPARGNQDNTFNSDGQSPVAVANPIECDFRGPDSNGSLTSFAASTNGLTEYRASNFGGAMTGDLLAAAFNNNIFRLELESDGAQLKEKSRLFSNVGKVPLDVIAQGDADVFPGTVWVADFSDRNIVVFEPSDYNGAVGPVCSGVANNNDDDGDGYTNADEQLSGSNPCSAADVPDDADGDLLSDRTDLDDDNDGLLDLEDPFALDPANGRDTPTRLTYSWENGEQSPGFLLNLGFSGLLNNGRTAWQNAYDPTGLTAGGAAGVLTVDAVSSGDARGGANDLQYGFQFGVDARPDSQAFVVTTRLVAPFAGFSLEENREMGLYIGTGDQDNFISLVATGAGATGTVRFSAEQFGVNAVVSDLPVDLRLADHIDLHLAVDPAGGAVTPYFEIRSNGIDTSVQAVGGATDLPMAWLTGQTGLAVGIMATSNGSTPFSATWDFIALTGLEVLDSDVQVSEPATIAYRVNAGGPQIQSASGPVWAADQGAAGVAVVGGSLKYASGQQVLGVEGPLAGPDEIYGTERYGVAGEDSLDYAFAVTPGRYEVRLHVAEMWAGAFAEGVRQFAVDIEGERLIAELDVYARYGARTGAVYSFTVDSDASLDVSLARIEQNPSLKAIEVLRVDGNGTGGTTDGTTDGNTGGVTSLTAVYRVNAGGPQIQSASGPVWAADQGAAGVAVVGGSLKYASGQQVLGVEGPLAGPDEIYGTERYGVAGEDSLDYAFAVTPGRYEVRLHVAEMWAGAFAEGVRQFAVDIEGERLIAELDVYARYGARTGAVYSFTVDSDASLDVSLARIEQNPSLKAIEVLRVDGNGTGGTTDGTTDGNTGGVTSLTAVYRVNAGGPQIQSASGPVWAADQGAAGVAVVGGSLKYASGQQVLGVEGPLAGPDEIYGTERYGVAGEDSLDYAFAVTPGRYEVRLHVAEMWAGAFAEGVRQFAVDIEGERLIAELDVYARYGARTGAVYSFTVDSDASLDVSLARIEQNPSLKAIEVLRVDDGLHN